MYIVNIHVYVDEFNWEILKHFPKLNLNNSIYYNLQINQPSLLDMQIKK